MSIKLPFFKKKRKELERMKLNNIPEHIAIIMDGNGRWAKKKGLPRIAGHKEGMTVVRKIVRSAVKYDIKTLTLYAFSTENWKRPDRKSTRLNSSHVSISYAVFCLKKKRDS